MNGKKILSKVFQEKKLNKYNLYGLKQKNYKNTKSQQNKEIKKKIFSKK